MEFLAALEGSSLGEWVRLSTFGEPILLVMHALGMAAVVGVVLAFDARVLGWASGIPLTAFEKMLPLAWAGFALNAASGLAIFSANGTHLITNWSFQAKMALILMGGLSVWFLWRRIQRKVLAVGGGELDADAGDKVVALLSISSWIAALWAGRMIAYTLVRF